MEGTLALAASAVVAGVSGHVDLAVLEVCDLDGAAFFDLADLTAAALVIVDLDQTLTDDTEVVEVGFYTVVGAAADGDLEFVRQLDIVPAAVEALVDLLGEGVGVDQTVLAGRTLAGNDGANLRACAAGLETVLGKECTQRFDICVRNALDLHGQTGGHGDLAAAETLCSFGDDLRLVCGDLAVAGDHAAVEAVHGVLVTQEAETFYTGDVLSGGSNGRARGGSLCLYAVTAVFLLGTLGAHLGADGNVAAADRKALAAGQCFSDLFACACIHAGNGGARYVHFLGAVGVAVSLAVDQTEGFVFIIAEDDLLGSSGVRRCKCGSNGLRADAAAFLRSGHGFFSFEII